MIKYTENYRLMVVSFEYEDPTTRTRITKTSELLIMWVPAGTGGGLETDLLNTL